MVGRVYSIRVLTYTGYDVWQAGAPGPLSAAPVQPDWEYSVTRNRSHEHAHLQLRPPVPPAGAGIAQPGRSAISTSGTKPDRKNRET